MTFWCDRSCLCKFFACPNKIMHFGFAHSMIEITYITTCWAMKYLRKMFIFFIFKWDIPLWWRFTEERVAAIRHKNILYSVTVYCNMLQLMYQEPLSGWQGTVPKNVLLLLCMFKFPELNKKLNGQSISVNFPIIYEDPFCSSWVATRRCRRWIDRDSLLGAAQGGKYF